MSSNETRMSKEVNLNRNGSCTEMYRICNLIVNLERTWANRKLRIRVLATRVFILQSLSSCLLSIIKIVSVLLSLTMRFLFFFFFPKQYRRAILKKANKSPRGRCFWSGKKVSTEDCRRLSISHYTRKHFILNLFFSSSFSNLWLISISLPLLLSLSFSTAVYQSRFNIARARKKRKKEKRKTSSSSKKSIR